MTSTGTINSAQRYFEIDDDGYVARLVYIFPDAVVTSRDDHDPLVTCTFIEHPIHDWDQTGLVEISKAVFEEAWNRPDPRSNPVRAPLQKPD